MAYDICKTQIRKIKKNHILYLDYNVNHLDTVEIRGQLSKKVENDHYERVKKTLKKIAKLYKKKVIVSIHPLYSLKYTKKKLPNFKVNKFNTVELIRDAEIVIFFNSTAINFAYLMKKKIINFSSNLLGENTKVETNIFPARSGIMKIDINKEFNYSKKDIEKSFNSGEKKNITFVKSYLQPDKNCIGLDKIVSEINKNFFN